MEAVVDIRVVDQSLPPNSGSGFLKVRAHDDKEIVGVAFFEFQETLSVVKGSGRVMDGARADDNEKASLRVRAVNDGNDVVASSKDGGFAAFGLGGVSWCRVGGKFWWEEYLGYLMLKEIRGRKWIDSSYWTVVS